MAESLEAPIVGAALTKQTLALHRDWILEKQRDLEIQDFFSSETLDGDWRSVGAEIRRLLDGYTGRLGIHGPFWGFKIDSQDPLRFEIFSATNERHQRTCHRGARRQREVGLRLRRLSIGGADRSARRAAGRPAAGRLPA